MGNADEVEAEQKATDNGKSEAVKPGRLVAIARVLFGQSRNTNQSPDSGEKPAPERTSLLPQNRMGMLHP
jgi:hypothetical protein